MQHPSKKSFHTSKQKTKGFTLSELLIALAILGIIATFSIPKILESSSNTRLKSIAKDTAAVVAGSYEFYKKASIPSWDMMSNPMDLINYMNYVEIITATVPSPSPPPGQTKLDNCSATEPCILLHSGAIIQYDVGMTFGGTDPYPNLPANTDFIFFNIDPDGFEPNAGVVSIILYYNGRMTTGGKAGAVTPNGNTLSLVTTDPPYVQDWN